MSSIGGVNGVLLVDKDLGMTSHDVVAKVRRVLGIRAIGHAGTLDPMASGLLLLLVGEATKISDYLLCGNKSYEVVIRLGIETDSLDMTGKILREIKTADLEGFREGLTQDLIVKVIEATEGGLTLPVPTFSAVKINGKKLYESAHQGKEPERVPDREMKFFNVKVSEIKSVGDYAEVRVRLSCSKGSFVRAWASHIGRELKVGAAVSELRRVESAPYSVTKALRISDIEQIWDSRERRSGEVFGEAWVALEGALPHFKRVDVAGFDATLLRNGQISKALHAELLRNVELGSELAPMRVISRDENRLLALLTAEPGQFYKIKRVFV